MWLDDRESPMKPGERRLGHDGELAGGGEPRSGKRARRQDQGIGRPQRVGARRTVAVEQIGAEAGPAYETLQDVVGQGFVVPLAGGEVDDQGASEVAVQG